MTNYVCMCQVLRACDTSYYRTESDSNFMSIIGFKYTSDGIGWCSFVWNTLQPIDQKVS